MKHLVANKAELLLLLQKNSMRIRSFGIKQLSLFGSFKRDEGIHENSDVDLIIEFEEGKHTYENKMNLYRLLTYVLGREVELIPPEALNSSSGPRILKEAEYVDLGQRSDTAHTKGTVRPFGIHNKSHIRRPRKILRT